MLKQQAAYIWRRSVSCHYCRIFIVWNILYATEKLAGNAEIYRSSYEKSTVFQLVARNTRLDVSVIGTIVANTLLMCSIQCISDAFCKSLNYHAKTRRCEKLSGSRLTGGESKLNAANSWEHYEPETVKVSLF